MVDYSVFDSFCKVPTWNTGHGSDEKRFFDCLAQVVEDPDFNASVMRAYIAANHSAGAWPKSQDEQDEVLDHLEAQAEAIYAFTHRHWI